MQNLAAAKRKENIATTVMVKKQNCEKQRVVLGELPNLLNLLLSETQY